jgi:hypothetical protein
LRCADYPQVVNWILLSPRTHVSFWSALGIHVEGDWRSVTKRRSSL